MNIFSRIFGRAKTIDDIFDKDDGHLTKIGKWWDERDYTDEESVKNQIAEAAAVRKFVSDTLNENTERSITRRDLALFIIKSWVLMLFMSGVVFPFNERWSEFLFKLSTTGALISLVLGVGAFFWGSHTLRTALPKKTGE